MKELVETIIRCNRMKQLVKFTKIKNELTLEDYDVIHNFQVVNEIDMKEFYKICYFVKEMKMNFIGTYRALELYYNINKGK
jgi:hypothetical protein